MSIWNWRESRKTKVNRLSEVCQCTKCKEDTLRLNVSIQGLCDKCLTISLYGVNNIGKALSNAKMSMYPESLTKQWKYIWHLGIEENGIEWYRTARDKLYAKLKKCDEAQLKKEENKKKKIKKTIDEW